MTTQVKALAIPIGKGALTARATLAFAARSSASGIASLSGRAATAFTSRSGITQFMFLRATLAI
jgi:hypothetical protein